MNRVLVNDEGVDKNDDNETRHRKIMANANINIQPEIFFPTILASWIKVFEEQLESETCVTSFKNLSNTLNTSCLPTDNESCSDNIIRTI